MVWLFVRGEDVSSQKLYFQCTAPGRFASAYGFIIHISPALKAPNQGILLLFYALTYTHMIEQGRVHTLLLHCFFNNEPAFVSQLLWKKLSDLFS